MPTVLNKSEAANRFGISLSTLEKWIHNGIIKPIKPGENYFSLAAIEAVEQSGLDPEQISALKLRKLEKELDRLQKENIELKSIIWRMWTPALPYINSNEESPGNLAEALYLPKMRNQA